MARNKRQRQEMIEVWGERKKEQKRDGREICLRGTKDCLWIERRQTSPKGKCQLIKGQREDQW